MRYVTFALLIAFLMAVAAVGCGSESDNKVPTMAEYKKQYEDLSNKTTALGATISTALNNTSSASNGKKVAKQFSDLADQTKELADKIEGTTPPANAKVRSDQQALAKGLSLAALDLSAIAKAADKYDFKAAGTAAKSLGGHITAVAEPHRSLDVIVLGKQPEPAAPTDGA